MKKSMTDYFLQLSDDNDFDLLEDIISTRYRKFLSFYWAICEYSDIISAMEYKETEEDTLKIELKIKKMKPEEFIEEFNDHLNSDILEDAGCELVIYANGKIVTVEIKKDESDLP